MMPAKPNPATRFFPSLADLAFVMPLLLLFGPMDGAKVLLGDGDTGWHLRTGEWILAHGRVPNHDMFSFTKPGQPWFAWEWLWDVIFGWLHLHWGLAAVVLGNALILAAVSALLFRLVRRRAGNDILAIVVTFVAVTASTIHWLARPHLVTLLLCVVFYSLLERARERRRVLWLLVPLMALWTNLHGGFLAGLLILLAYAAGELVAALIDDHAETRHAALARSRNYGLALAGCAAATLANPYGYRLHVHLYRYLTDSFLWDHVMEFQPFSFRRSESIFFEVLLGLGIAAAYGALVRRDFAKVFLLVGWWHMALFAQRNVPLFAFLAAPEIALTVGAWIERLRVAAPAAWVRKAAAGLAETAAEFSEMDRVPRWRLASALAPVCLGVLLFAPSAPAKFRAVHDEKRFPAGALEFLGRDGTPKEVFATDQWGDYLIYRLYPTRKVFVDGRSDFYGARFDETYLDILNAKDGWERTLVRYGVNTILVPVDTPLVGALKESRRWRAVYDDGRAIVFRSAAPPQPAVVPPAALASSGAICDRVIAQRSNTKHPI